MYSESAAQRSFGGIVVVRLALVDAALPIAAFIAGYSCRGADFLQYQLLQLTQVRGKISDAFGKFFGCHGVFIHAPPEFPFGK